MGQTKDHSPQILVVWMPWKECKNRQEFTCLVPISWPPLLLEKGQREKAG